MTLKFKRDRTTIALFVKPDQSFASIKQAFLDALKSRGITHFKDQAVPTSIDEITFAKLKAPNDPNAGWEVLRIGQAQGAKKGKSHGGNALDCPAGQLLKDGATLAFKFGEPPADDDGKVEAEDDGFEVTFPSLDVEEPDQLPS